MRQMMEGVVLQGTGKRAVLPGYTSGGKTGSAQIYDAALRAYSHTYNASFLGFAPVANPKIVISVTLNGTTGGTTGFGGVRAAPVFRNVATNALRMLDVPKDLPGSGLPDLETLPSENDLSIAGLGSALADQAPLELDEAPPAQRSVSSVTQPLVRGESPVSAGGSAADQRHFLKTEAAGRTSGKDGGGEPTVAARGLQVPDFRGMTLRDVLEESTAAGIKVELLGGSGLARSQEPPPGSALSRRAPVRIHFER
jgi:cell division protein FtsI (penicillin-binding protein 3)